MKIENKVLACVDQSPFADHVGDYAAWAAVRMDAPLELLHVIERHPEIGDTRDHSGALTPNAQEHLLSELSEQDEMYTRRSREQGRVFLNRLRERALAAGVASVDMRQRHGHLDETLRDWEPGVRLFVLGRHGQSGAAGGQDMGSNVERVVRMLQRPVLTVTEGFKPPQRVLIAFDGSALTRRGVQMVADSPLLRGLPITLQMAGKLRQDGPREISWAAETLTAAGFDVRQSIRDGEAEKVILETIAAEDVDLLVMGAYSHARWRSLLFGSRTDTLLRAVRIPALLLR
ncbi:MAG: universal stress protein [Rhodoferax sp.]|jgi:nucleotide-binding universal stress UspA family protein|nr:universal stress protein [Rhodoferax sp.]